MFAVLVIGAGILVLLNSLQKGSEERRLGWAGLILVGLVLFLLVPKKK